MGLFSLQIIQVKIWLFLEDIIEFFFINFIKKNYSILSNIGFNQFDIALGTSLDITFFAHSGLQ